MPKAAKPKPKAPRALQRLVDKAKAEPTPKILGGIARVAAEAGSGLAPATLTDNGSPVSLSAPFGRPRLEPGQVQPAVLEPEDVEGRAAGVHDPKFDAGWDDAAREIAQVVEEEPPTQEAEAEIVEEDPFSDLPEVALSPLPVEKAEPEVLGAARSEPPAELAQEEPQELAEVATTVEEMTGKMNGLLEEMAGYRKENERLRGQIEIVATRSGAKKIVKELEEEKELNAKLQAQLQKKPKIITDGKLTLPQWEGKDVRVLMPCYKTSNPGTTAAIIALMLDFGREKIGYFDRLGDAMVYHSRNQVAEDFMQSGAQWGLWIDDDIIPPVGRPDFTRKYIGAPVAEVPDRVLAVHVLHRLLQANQKLVGGCYFGRRRYSPAMFHEGITDQVAYQKAKTVSGEVLPTQWVATGCLLTHRDVFLGIQKACPELAPSGNQKVWDYFRPGADGGEDVMFCARARKAGIQPHVDTGVQCYHVGFQAFGWHNTTNEMPAEPLTPGNPRPWWK